MIARFQFETGVLAETIRECGVEGVDIDRLDSADSTFLRTMVTTAVGHERLKPALSTDSTVGQWIVLESMDGTHSYLVDLPGDSRAAGVYRSLITHGGVFVAGTAGNGTWELRVRFPGRDDFEGFRSDCPGGGSTLDIQAVCENHTSVRTKRCPLSEQQAELIRLAAREGYFEVPREQSLSDLAADLDISTQAASERLRRGLDSLVDETLPRKE